MSQPREATALRAVDEQLLARWPEIRLQPSLTNIRMLTDLLGRPQRAFETIHITGTNGKASTARMIEALLYEIGHYVGRFTSPHLVDIRERISFDAALIDEQRFLASDSSRPTPRWPHRRSRSTRASATLFRSSR
jgi:dihydrofolate synthase/folylpolyglutamate synthase